MNNFSVNLDKNDANYIPLTPLTFIERTKDVYPDYESIVYGDRNYTWLQTYKDALNLLAHSKNMV